MAKFDSKSFNPQAFGAYVDRVPNTKKTELAKSGAVGSNEQARTALSDTLKNSKEHILFNIKLVISNLCSDIIQSAHGMVELFLLMMVCRPKKLMLLQQKQ